MNAFHKLMSCGRSLDITVLLHADRVTRTLVMSQSVKAKLNWQRIIWPENQLVAIIAGVPSLNNRFAV